MPFVLALLMLIAGQPANGVSVTTDSDSYAVGDAVLVSVVNGGQDHITRGGLACDALWPLALERYDVNGVWQPLPVPQTRCIGVASVIVGPGQTQARTIDLSLDPGIYRVVYGFDDLDTGTYEIAASDPFEVTAPPVAD